jgi:antitoxin component YwqK of YwqJK toxin-antitoxin module
MKLFILFFLSCISVKSQTKDTTQTSFYKDGQIMSYIIKSNYTHNNNMYVLLDSICDKQRQKQRIIRQSTFDSNNWNNDMFYYKDSLMINYRYGFKRKPYIGITEFHLLFLSKEKKNIGIDIEFNKDSLVTRILIYKPKVNKLEIDKYYSDFNTNPTSMKANLQLIIDSDNSLNIEFLEKNILKNISYFHKDINDDDNFFKTIILFYKNNNPKEYGDFQKKIGRKGKWYTYYENGKLSSAGEYNGSVFDSNGNEVNNLKTGKWVYYTEQGCIDKEENWENGKLISRL